MKSPWKKTSLNTQILFGVLTGIVLGLGVTVLKKESEVALVILYLADLM